MKSDDRQKLTMPDTSAGERRRPGRADKVSPTLLPLLRDPAKSATASSGCAGCKGAKSIFPFTMAFQPIIDLQECRIDAHEALVRGVDGSGAGHVLAQLNAANLYTFDQACRVKAIELAVALGIEGRLNINFLPNAVYEPRACIQTTLETAARTGFDPHQLTFEIVETETIADTPHLLRIISEYRRQGFQIALDDFGTGYSGLSRLAELQPDIIKIDRALAMDCDQSRVKLAILASVVALGADIGIKVVVEGVERRSEVDALRSVGVRFMQGFYFARPSLAGLARAQDIPWLSPAIN